jgi:hypothetical protein
MGEMRIDKLTLNVSGWDKNAARRFADLLTGMLTEFAGDGTPMDRTEPVRVRLTATPHESGTRLAEQTADRIAREIRRG